MNSNQKAFLFGGLLSLAGAAVGAVAYILIENLLLYGVLAAVNVFDPSVLISIVAGFVFSLNGILFAVFYTMFVMSRGLTVQNTLYWAGFTLIFNLIFGMLSGGAGALSLLGIFMMALQTLCRCFGAHFGLSFFRR